MDKKFDVGVDAGNVTFKGTQEEIIEQIMEVFAAFDRVSNDADREYAELLLETLKKYQRFLGDDEIFMTYREEDTGGKKLILEEKCLHINIRQASFFLLLKLLDKVLLLPSGGIIQPGDALQIFQSEPVMVFLQEIQGELCVLMETARCGRKGTDANLLIRDNKRQECINNHYQCEYNQDGKCSCTPEKVNSILEHLCELGVLKKKFWKYYYSSDFLLDLSE